jgi:hypothetical protein
MPSQRDMHSACPLFGTADRQKNQCCEEWNFSKLEGWQVLGPDDLSAQQWGA